MKIKSCIIIIVLLFSLVALSMDVIAKDSDLDGIEDSLDNYPYDYDNDGMPDIWEKKIGLRYDINDAREDSDNDGINNIDEYKQGTNPLISDKTGARTQTPILLTPVEQTMARGLVWVGAGLFLLLLLIFILYRIHIFRIFKYMHHVSKQHFYRQNMTRNQQIFPARRPVQAPVFSYRPINNPKVFIPEQQKSPIQQAHGVVLDNDGYVSIEQLQKPKPFEKLSSYTPKDNDIFGKLAGHITKKEDSFEKLAKVVR
ncbi:MAG: thrombospondin type 3 repeat-containing protein [Nanoarchaeota archaeon]